MTAISMGQPALEKHQLKLPYQVIPGCAKPMVKTEQHTESPQNTKEGEPEVHWGFEISYPNLK